MVHNAEEVAGVLSERDIVAALGRNNTIIDFARIGDLMTSSVVTISPKDTLINAVNLPLLVHRYGSNAAGPGALDPPDEV